MKVEQTQTDDTALNKLGADFKLYRFVSTAWRTHNTKIKEIKKRRALIGKHPALAGLTNSAGK